jgi:hypothetical protein
VQPSEGSPKIQTYVRADVDINEWFRPGLWLQYRNVDMRPNSLVGCIDDGSAIEQNDRNEDGSISFRSGCLAEVGQVTGRFGFHPLKGKLGIIAQYQHEFIHDVSVDPRLPQDSLATLIVRANPISTLRISGRLRYLFEDIQDNTYLEQSLWAYFDVAYVIKRVFLIRVRYDIYQWLDERGSTPNRNPNPEHRLRLELEARF